MTTLEDLRAEFGHVDMLYVRRNHPYAIRLAGRYNALRTSIDPGDPASIVAARKALARLMKAVA